MAGRGRGAPAPPWWQAPVAAARLALALILCGVAAYLVALAAATTFGHAAIVHKALTVVVVWLVTATVVVMATLALDLTLLHGRLKALGLTRRLHMAVWQTGVAAIVIGLIGYAPLAAGAAVYLLPPAMLFVMVSALSPGFLERRTESRGTGRDKASGKASGKASAKADGKASGKADGEASDAGSSQHRSKQRTRQRQRRGGRTRR